MKAEEFKRVLQNPLLSNNLMDKGVTIEDDLEISDIVIDFTCNNQFKNITFSGSVSFANIDLKTRIQLYNCTFKKGISFWQIFSNDVGNTHQIEIINCSLSKLSIGFCNNIFGISIANNSKIDYLDIYNCSEIHYIHIIDNEYNENISLFNLNEVKTVFLSGNKNINKCIYISDSKLNKLHLGFNNITISVDIQKIEVKEVILINNESFNKIKFTNGNRIETLQLEDNITKNQLEITCDSSTKIDNISISGGDYGHGLVINGSLEFKSIERINYISSQKNIGPFYFNNLYLDWFILEGTVSNSSIVLNNILLSDLTIRNLFNYGVISISGLICKPNENDKLEIQNSSLGNFEIMSCDFSLFTQVEIVKSSLVTLKTIQTTWFEPNNLNKLYPISIDSLRTKREVYRQLKQAMSGQGDTIQSLEFKSLEMKEYKNELSLLPITDWNWKHISDRLIMFMNQSNNFGLNWIKPVILAVIFTLSTYIFLSTIVFFKNPILYDYQCGLIYNLGVYLIQYKYRFFLLLDPIFKLNVIFDCNENYKFSFLEYLVSFVHRVGIVYFSFQTVAAFRKYLK